MGAIYQGSNRIADTVNGGFGDIEITHNHYSFGANALPDWVNRDPTNWISTNNGTYTILQNGFVAVSATISAGTGRARFLVNNVAAFVHVLSTPNLACGALIPVKQGDVVSIVVEGTFGQCWCNFIPPVVDSTPDPLKPWTWNSNGNEINLGDNTYGRRYVGTITSAGNELASTSLNTIMTALNTIIIDFGGWFRNGNNPDSTRVLLKTFYNRGGTVWDGAQFSYPVVNTAGFTIHTITSGARSGAGFDVWLRYQKL